jgi:hypothetical protein
MNEPCAKCGSEKIIPLVASWTKGSIRTANLVNKRLLKQLKTRGNDPYRVCVNSWISFLVTVSFGGLVGTQFPISS